MSMLEEKLDALLQLLAAETDPDMEEAKDQIRELLKCHSEERVVNKDVDSEIRRVLLDIGIPDHILGHRYLVTALTLAIGDPTIINDITTRLYPAVAKVHNTTGSRAERAIRHAVEVAFDRGDLGVFAKFFGNTISPNKGKPTNSEFVARIANVIRSRIRIRGGGNVCITESVPTAVLI